MASTLTSSQHGCCGPSSARAETTIFTAHCGTRRVESPDQDKARLLELLERMHGDA
jgi:hypothetical protein